MININLEINPKFENIDIDRVKDLIKNILISERIHESEILIILTDDDTVSKLKKDFFNEDHYTDVIAFRLNEYEETEVEGEVYISIPQVQRNAKKFNEPFARELARVIIHGNLHLLDYRDQTPDEKEVMIEKEEYFLENSDWIGIA